MKAAKETFVDTPHSCKSRASRKINQFGSCVFVYEISGRKVSAGFFPLNLWICSRLTSPKSWRWPKSWQSRRMQNFYGMSLGLTPNTNWTISMNTLETTCCFFFRSLRTVLQLTNEHAFISTIKSNYIDLTTEAAAVKMFQSILLKSMVFSNISLTLKWYTISWCITERVLCMRCVPKRLNGLPFDMNSA